MESLALMTRGGRGGEKKRARKKGLGRHRRLLSPCLFTREAFDQTRETIRFRKMSDKDCVSLVSLIYLRLAARRCGLRFLDDVRDRAMPSGHGPLADYSRRIVNRAPRSSSIVPIEVAADLFEILRNVGRTACDWQATKCDASAASAKRSRGRD